MKNALLVLSVIIFSMACYSQDTSGKQNWKKEKDYKKSEKQVAENILWLEQNPNIENKEEVKVVYAYVMKWSMGCPYLVIKMDPSILIEMQESTYEYKALMITAYMLGKTLYAIKHVEGNKSDEMYRGIIGMINTYNSIVDIKGEVANNDIVENYKELLEKEQLKDYIKKKGK